MRARELYRCSVGRLGGHNYQGSVSTSPLTRLLVSNTRAWNATSDFGTETHALGQAATRIGSVSAEGVWIRADTHPVLLPCASSSGSSATSPCAHSIASSQELSKAHSAAAAQRCTERGAQHIIRELELPSATNISARRQELSTMAAEQQAPPTKRQNSTPPSRKRRRP